MARSAEEKQLETKLKGVMEFYVSTYFEFYTPKIKETIRSQNFFLDSDLIDRQIEDHIKQIVEEATTKIHDVVMLLFDTLMSGREDKVREFELLFIDLIKRTLVDDLKEAKRMGPPIVIIADPNVNAEEN